MGRKLKKKTQGSGSVKIEDINTNVETPDHELEILESILDIPNSAPEKYSKIKFVLFASAIFMLLSLPFTDRIIELANPIANSWLILLIIKTIMFFVLYYIVVCSQS